MGTTQRAYLQQISQFARHFGKSPEVLGPAPQGAGWQQPAPRQHLPALRSRSLGPSMASPACARTGYDRPLCRRLRHGLRERGRRAANAGDLKERLARFGLTLHEDKTRLIEFGRFAALSRQKRGERRPETFAFLGFTHYCGLMTRDGRFIVKHNTQSNRLTRKLKEVRQEAWRRMHTPLTEQHRWFASILRGHYGYFGMPHNWPALNGFLRQVRRIWLVCLRRRSQKSRRMGWDWFERLTSRFPLPPTPRITHPWTPRAA